MGHQGVQLTRLLISCAIFFQYASLKCKGAYLSHLFCCTECLLAAYMCVWELDVGRQQHKCRSFAPRYPGAQLRLVARQGSIVSECVSTPNVWIFVTGSADALLRILLITRLAAHASLFRRFLALAGITFNAQSMSVGRWVEKMILWE